MKPSKYKFIRSLSWRNLRAISLLNGRSCSWSWRHKRWKAMCWRINWFRTIKIIGRNNEA